MKKKLTLILDGVEFHISSAKFGRILPADLWAGMRVACTVALWPWQRCTEIVGVGLVINGAENQPRLVT